MRTEEFQKAYGHIKKSCWLPPVLGMLTANDKVILKSDTSKTTGGMALFTSSKVLWYLWVSVKEITTSISGLWYYRVGTNMSSL